MILDEYLYRYNRLNDNSITNNFDFTYYKNLVNVIEIIERILIDNRFSIEYIDEILKERVQSLTISLVMAQTSKKQIYSIKYKYIKILFNDKYFKKYKYDFYSQKLTEKIIITLIKRGWISGCILYSYILHKIQNARKILKKRV